MFGEMFLSMRLEGDIVGDVPSPFPWWCQLERGIWNGGVAGLYVMPAAEEFWGPAAPKTVLPLLSDGLGTSEAFGKRIRSFCFLMLPYSR